MNKFIMIDGSSMLVTSYHANLPFAIQKEHDLEKQKQYYNQILHNSKGEYTNALFGMMRMLLNIVKEQKPTHMVVAFDKTRNTFRKQMYPDYKGNRGGTAEPLKEQFIAAEKMLEDLGFHVLVHDNYEADDLIGSVVAMVEKEQKEGNGNWDTNYVITKDHDYLQLVSDYTRLWLLLTTQDDADKKNQKYAEAGFMTGLEFSPIPKKAFEITPRICYEWIEEKGKGCGVYPSQVPDLKGIMGDKSDNIPGVKGVSSAAVPLLREYGTIENLYKVINAEDEQGQKELVKFWKESLGISRNPLKYLLEGEDSAYLSKELATIKRDIEINRSLDDFEFQLDKDAAIDYFKRYEFESLLKKL